MRKITFLLLSTFFCYYALNAQVDARSGATLTEITLSSGQDFINEIYFKLDQTSGHTVALNEWDIAFTKDLMDASIRINSGNGIELYKYSDDIADWATVDTAGFEFTPLYNSLENWKVGAFNTVATGGQFDFGWGAYDMSTHNVVGSKIFIIKLAEDDYRKILIIEKVGMGNQYNFKYAKLDGTDEVTANIDAGASEYENFSYIHYSLTNQEVVLHEPNTDWQLLFTRYFDNSISHMVSGVLSNSDVKVQEVKQDGLNQETYNTYDASEFNEEINTIGSDWKSFDMGTMTYTIADDVVYFVREGEDGEVWKMFFTGFGGSTTGDFTFKIEKILTNIDNAENRAFSTVYPNPANNMINIIYDIDGKANLDIVDINGKIVYSESINHNNSLNKHSVDVSNLEAGIYFVMIKKNSQYTSYKFIKN